MPYVKILITTPKLEVTSALDVEEFKKYIDNETTNKFTSDKNFTDNFNENAPQSKEYKLKILEVTDKKPFVNDATMDRLTLAEYALNCYRDPEEVLNNISDKLYQYKHLFGGRKLKLNSMESIKSEKSALKKYYTDFQKKNAEYTEQKSNELINFVMEQSKQRGR